MTVSFEDLDRERTRWLKMTSPAGTIELLVKYASPREAERFRQKLVREGIMKVKDGTHTINTGRDRDFFREYAAYYVLNWRGDIEVDYNPDQMALLLSASNTAYEQLAAAISDEASFFTGNDNASTS